MAETSSLGEHVTWYSAQAISLVRTRTRNLRAISRGARKGHIECSPTQLLIGRLFVDIVSTFSCSHILSGGFMLFSPVCIKGDFYAYIYAKASRFHRCDPGSRPRRHRRLCVTSHSGRATLACASRPPRPA